MQEQKPVLMDFEFDKLDHEMINKIKKMLTFKLRPFKCHGYSLQLSHCTNIINDKEVIIHCDIRLFGTQRLKNQKALVFKKNNKVKILDFHLMNDCRAPFKEVINEIKAELV